MMSDLEWRASEFATVMHNAKGQLRKYTNAPYWTHPAAVAEIVRSVPHTEVMIAAAWLHDVVEDCGVAIETIETSFGHRVAMLVGWLTDISKSTDGNRAARKAIDREHTAKAPVSAKTIKLADLIDNSATIVEYDPTFARVYIQEKRALLEVLEDGNMMLLDRAWNIVEAAERTLGLP